MLLLTLHQQTVMDHTDSTHLLAVTRFISQVRDIVSSAVKVITFYSRGYCYGSQSSMRDVRTTANG